MLGVSTALYIMKVLVASMAMMSIKAMDMPQVVSV